MGDWVGHTFGLDVKVKRNYPYTRWKSNSSRSTHNLVTFLN